MRLLVVGGSGYVGSLLLPYLARRHAVRILDLVAPGGAGLPPGVEYVPGDATDAATLRAALAGTDAVLHAAMGGTDPGDDAAVRQAFAVNVLSAYLTVSQARLAGVPHVVHLSSLSVFADVTARRIDESTPPDAADLYGLTKRLGEQAVRAAAGCPPDGGAPAAGGAGGTGAAAGADPVSVNVLRLAWPTPDADWPRWARVRPARMIRAAGGGPIRATAASDLAAAVLAALDFRDGFQVFTVCGDDRAGDWSTARARRLLGWAPRHTVPGGPARL